MVDKHWTPRQRVWCKCPPAAVLLRYNRRRDTWDTPRHNSTRGGEGRRPQEASQTQMDQGTRPKDLLYGGTWASQTPPPPNLGPPDLLRHGGYQ